MEAFLISISTVALAEMGDRTQLLALLLATRFRRPWPILAAILCAAVANHIVAALIGVWIGSRLSPTVLDAAVGAGMILMALWMLKPDKVDGQEDIAAQRGVFLTTLITFSVAELGDKTQLATLALAAGYHNLPAVVAGATCGMVLVNAPVVFIGKLFADRLPMRAIHYTASVALILVGAFFLVRAGRH
ncbi:MAG TPA: TMEM165/GDT1 family protein [Steroidobacteraceae bacterium]|jgi:putative Ca2+/H+ antiporter (TMEM165/GDT1 family)|nr:TMEM165/GDT1 family protein [Steroidobacteraceae bacterium]